MTTIEYTDSLNLYEDRVFGYVFKQTKNRELSKEIVQEAYMKLWINKTQVEVLKAKSWLFTTAYNHMINMLKKENRYVRDYDGSKQLIDGESRLVSTDDIIEFNQRDVIQAELKKLPVRDRRLIILRDMHGFTYEEIGTKMGLNEPQVKVYLFRVRKKLKERFKDLSR